MTADWGAIASTLDALGEEFGLEFVITNITDSGDGYGSRGIQVAAVDRLDRTLPPRAVVVRPLITRPGYAGALSDERQLHELMHAALECVARVDADRRRWTLRMCVKRSPWAA